MILDVGSNLRSLQSINSHTVGSESATYYGPIFFFVVTLLILLIIYLSSREPKSNDPN